MDEADIANDRAEQFTAEALRNLRKQADTTPSTGICKSCGESIETERLKVNPAARLCCDCAEEEETARKRAQRLGG